MKTFEEYKKDRDKEDVASSLVATFFMVAIIAIVFIIHW